MYTSRQTLACVLFEDVYLFTCFPVYFITWKYSRSRFSPLQVSTFATLISMLIGLPLGSWLALGNFRGRSFILKLHQHRHGIAARRGWSCSRHVIMAKRTLGDLRLIYTPWAIVIAQTIIATPVVTGLTAAALNHWMRDFNNNYWDSALHAYRWSGTCGVRRACRP